MTTSKLLGPFCQSCSTRLNKPEDFGTDIVGYRVNDYCRHCYANGVFTEPDITLQEMTDKCVDVMVRQGIMPEAKARTLMLEVLPRMKRWRLVTATAAICPSGRSRRPPSRAIPGWPAGRCANPRSRGRCAAEC